MLKNKSPELAAPGNDSESKSTMGFDYYTLRFVRLGLQAKFIFCVLYIATSTNYKRGGGHFHYDIISHLLTSHLLVRTHTTGADPGGRKRELTVFQLEMSKLKGFFARFKKDLSIRNNIREATHQCDHESWSQICGTI